MRKVVISLLIIIVAQGFILVDEETLVLVASVVWLDAAGGLIRSALKSVLEDKGDSIKEKFSWYLGAKKRLLELLIAKHESRKMMAEEMSQVYGAYVSELVDKGVAEYLKSVHVVSNYAVKNDLVQGGLSVVNDMLLEELEEVMTVADKPMESGVNWFKEGLGDRKLVEQSGDFARG